MTRNRPSPAVDQSVTVTVPAHLRVTVANYLVERAAEYPEHSRTRGDLMVLAAQVHKLTVTGRA